MSRPIILKTQIKIPFNMWLAVDVTISSYEFRGIATYPVKYKYVYTENIPYKN